MSAGINYESRGVLRGLLWISPWIAGFVIFMALPIAMSLYLSFTDFPILEKPLPIGWANYAELFTDGIFHTVLFNTLVYAGLYIPITVCLAVLLAELLNRGLRGQRVFRAAIFLPTIVPVVAASMVWMWLFNGEIGLINQGLSLIGIDGPNWLEDKRTAMPALVFMSLWVVGQPVVIILAALQEVPPTLYEAATLDGAGAWRSFVNVTLPSISPVLFFTVIVLTINSFQVFAVPYVMTDGGPGHATYFYTMYLYDNAFVFQRMGYASAMAWVQFLIILALTGVAILVSKRLVHYKVD